MERKQKRGWLKFTLTTVMAMAFMGVMAVSAFAGSVATVSLVPTDVPAGSEADLAMFVHVELPTGQNLVNLAVHVSWPANLLGLHYDAIVPGLVYVSVHELDGPPLRWVVLEQPPIGDVRAGNMISLTASSFAGANAPITESGNAALLLFSLPDSIAPGDIQFTITLDDATSLVGDPVVSVTRTSAEISMVAVPAMPVQRVAWGVVAGTAAQQAFVDAVVFGPAAEWFAWLHNDVWQGQDGLRGAGTIYEALIAAQAWIDAAAA